MKSHSPIIVSTSDLRPGIVPMLSGLYEARLLHTLITTLAIRPHGVVENLTRGLAKGALSQPRDLVARRVVPSFLATKTRTYPTRELVRAVCARYMPNEVLNDRIWWWAERGFDRTVARRWAGVAPVMYGFELAAAETFRAQKQSGGWCILGQFIAHHRIVYSILEEELERFPAAATAYLRRGLRTAARVNALKDEQYEHSDLIVANSAFVKETFVDAGIPAGKIIVVPGAGPAIDSPPTRMSERRTDRTVFLSAGTQSIRKGTPYLLDAWRALQPAFRTELWMAGKVELPPALLAHLPGHAEVLGPLAHAELSRRYDEASVLVLPSLCEGFALVILEAMAHGLPIITTPNSGCGDFVEDGVNGWMVPIRDAAALADRMSWCCENPSALIEMGERSREKARKWTWKDYERVHTEAICLFIAGL